MLFFRPPHFGVAVFGAFAPTASSWWSHYGSDDSGQSTSRALESRHGDLLASRPQAACSLPSDITPRAQGWRSPRAERTARLFSLPALKGETAPSA